MKEVISKWLANRMPDRLLYWTVIHLWARLTTTQFTDKAPDEVTVWDALKALEPKHG